MLSARILRAPAAFTLISTAVASNVTSIDFTGLSSAYGRYLFAFDNLLPASDAALQLRTSADGVTWDAGATDYSYAFGTTATSSSTNSGVGSAGTTSVPLGGTGLIESTAANGGLSGELWLIDPSNTSKNKSLIWTGEAVSATAVLSAINSSAQRLSTAVITGVRFLANGVNISGTVRLYGAR